MEQIGLRGHGVGEQLHIQGKYTVSCIRPRTREEGQRIADYVKAHPELCEQFAQPNIEAAHRLGIPLMEAWSEEIKNTVVTVGKNAMLDNALAGSGYTVTGPYMGLISSNSYSAISAADTMSSHAGWLEAGSATNPFYTSPRKTAAWSAATAGSKALSSALSFSITSNGTAKGAFLVFGSGALSQIDSTAGTLFSAGLFSGGDRALLAGDTLNVSYSCSL